MGNPGEGLEMMSSPCPDYRGYWNFCADFSDDDVLLAVWMGPSEKTTAMWRGGRLEIEFKGKLATSVQQPSSSYAAVSDDGSLTFCGGWLVCEGRCSDDGQTVKGTWWATGNAEFQDVSPGYVCKGSSGRFTMQ